jgi:ribosome-associated toxin RatA of RatAB toxin-antitoxin module
MRSEVSIHINAPPDLVYSLVSDLDHWAVWLNHYRYVRVLERTQNGVRAAMSAWRGPIPVFWHAVQEAESTTRTIRFKHVRGLTRGMDVLWTIEPEEKGTRARIYHDLDLKWPVIGPWVAEQVIARHFIEPIAGRTLVSFKNIAELI